MINVHCSGNWNKKRKTLVVLTFVHIKSRANYPAYGKGERRQKNRKYMHIAHASEKMNLIFADERIYVL
jgi:hypothetical protein